MKTPHGASGDLVMGWKCLLLSTVLLACGAAFADTHEAGDWLRRMAQTVRERNYDGIFVYQHGNMLQSMRVIHRAAGAGERERLFALDGARREILRDEHRVVCILPEQEGMWADPRGPQSTLPMIDPAEADRLGRHYVFRVGGEERVAGRTGRSIGILPGDGDRYGYLLTLDAETAFPLSSARVDHAGAIVEQMRFTTLSLPDALDARLLEPMSDGRYLVHDNMPAPIAPTTNGGFTWRLRVTPQGFTPRLRERRALPGGGTVEHAVWSDGLSAFSVYVEHMGEGQGLTGPATMGATRAWGRRSGPWQITVVGELPETTVERIGNDVEIPAGEAAK